MFLEKTAGGVRYLYSTLLDCPHAFSTKEGGVSTLPHLQSMNLGENRGDAPENVQKNFLLLESAAGLPSNRVGGAQIHSATVLYAEKPFEARPECDGFFTDQKNLTLYVKIADCIPILLYAPDAGAVAALHAGWRGSAADIAGVGVKKLQSLGADPKNIRAAIGVGICPACYEVGQELVDAFTASIGKDCLAFFSHDPLNHRIFADLKGINRYLLLRAGVREEHIDVCPRCTCHESHLFFSHRATKGLRGTMAAGIALPAKQ
ncbi:MAG: peptidoglycan editing factor PgeF [Clostridia bacterium]|nr:peptidoglycan editing factor PgeF [Clostridia bacterium]MBQ8399668.1 peptidoglycan editing factor PgeF [Clostridia bacterium]